MAGFELSTEDNQYTTANVATIIIGGLLFVFAVIETVNPGWAG